MAETKGDKEWINRFLEAEPEGDEWKSLVPELKRRLKSLDPEDQVRVVERLGALSENDVVREVIERVSGFKGLSLPALIGVMKIMGKIGKPRKEDQIKQLEHWLVLCEQDSDQCEAQDFFQLPEKAQKAVVDHLVLWLRGDLIARLQEAAPDKDRRKELRKALHRVRSAGVAIPAPGGSGEKFIMAEREEHVDEAYLAPPDPAGTFLIYLYRTVMGKNNLFVILVNDREGVIKFEGYAVPLPRFRKILEATKKNPHAIIVKVDPGYVRRLIRKAESAGRKRGRPQHEDYLSNRRMLGIVDEPEAEHPLWSRLGREETGKERVMAMQSHQLLDHRMFEDWWLSPLDEGKFMVELKDLEHSLIELSPVQKKDRKHRLFEKEAKRVIEEEGRQVWQDRMVACAYLLLLIGEEETARMAAATGLSLDYEDQAPPSFFVELLRRTMKRETGEDDEGNKGPDMDRGGIVLL